MSDSFWKKEISFGKKPKAEEPAAPEAASAAPVEPVAPAEPKQSFWKKEIGPKKTSKADAPAPELPVDPAAAAPAPAPAAAQTSMWKKEISFSRKQKVEWDAAEPKQKVPVWKKEISFGKKKAPSEVDLMAAEAAQAVSPEFAPPSVAAVPAPEVQPTLVAEAAVAAMAEPPAPVAPPEPVAPAAPVPLEPVAPSAPVSLEPTPVEPTPVEATPVEPVPDVPVADDEPVPVPELPVGLAAVASEPPAPVEPEPEPAADPAPAAPYVGLSPAILAASAADEPAAPEPVAPAAPAEPDSWLASPELPPEPEAPVAAAAAFAAAPEPEPVAPVAPAPGPVVPAAPAPEPPAAPEPVAPAAAEAVAPAAPAPMELPAQRTVFPPVPAAALAPVVEKKTPWYKKEIGGSKKAKADFDAMDAAVLAAAASQKKTPWYKKELGGKKKAQEPELVPTAVPGAVDVAALAAVEPKTPWYKKELIGGKKKQQAAVDAAALGVAAGAATAVAVEAAEPAPKTPWYKKELVGGKKKQQAAAVAAVAAVPAVAPDGTPVAAAPDDAAAPSEPFWKKPVFTLAAPSLSRGKGGGGKSLKGQKIVGLKVGASQIAAARITNNGVAELEQVARQPLPMGIVVGGELRDPDALAEALKVFFQKNKLPKKGVRLGIANANRIGVRIYANQSDDDKKIANAMEYQAQSLLNIPLDEAVLDWQVVDEAVDPEGVTTKKVMLVVAYRDLVDRYVDACRKAGITLAGVDLEAFALLRALGAPAEAGERGTVAVAIGFDRSTFAVTDGRTCDFTRVLDWGGWSLNTKLADAFNSSPSEVEALKCSLALDNSISPPGVPPESVALALDTVRRELSSFARMLVESLTFYQNQPGSLPFGEIVITGGTAQMPGLADELARLTGVPVRVGNPLGRVKVAKRVAAQPQAVGSLAVAIGLGIED